jgi:curved DNA-binding protein CbpA
MTENPYEVLGLQPSADDHVIRRTYKRLIRELHPDVNGDPAAAEMAARINAAYQVLGNPERRAAFHSDLGNVLRGWTYVRGRYWLGYRRVDWCAHCGRRMAEVRPFKRTDALYCSNACRQAAYRARKATLKLLNPG